MQALQAAAKALLGDDFQIVPEFTFADGARRRVGQCRRRFHAGESARLPEDDGSRSTFRSTSGSTAWRVSGRCCIAWEAALMLADAFGSTRAVAHPIQLPVRRDDAMAGAAVSRPTTRSTATAALHRAVLGAVRPDARQCGLLLDEWTEVIPAHRRATPAITFNYQPARQ